MPPVAHATHWLESVVFMAPVIAFLGWLGVTWVRDRRRGDSPSGGGA